jgi:hypothetical protein
MTRIISIFLAAFVIGLSTLAFGQETTNLRVPDSTKMQILILQDGSELIGRITAVSDSAVTFQSALGSSNVYRARIREIREIPVASLKSGQYWFANPNATRLYFSPTARMLKKGEGYFSDYYIFFPGISYGLTDNITIGGGLSIIPGPDLTEQAYYFTPKIGLNTSEKTSLALGALVISIPHKIGDENIPTVGIVYGVGTYGGPDDGLTGGLGFGFVNNKIAHNPAVMIGGEKRVSRRVSLVSENWIFPGIDHPLISYGARFFGENLSVDLGFLNVLGSDLPFPGVPWVDFVFNFR